MTAIESFLSQEIVQRIGWALIHFVWQGAAVALGLAGCTFLLRRRSANARYLAACAAMILMTLLPAVTFWVQGIPAAKETPAPASSQAIGISPFSPPGEFAPPEVQGGAEATGARVSAELPAERASEPLQRVSLPRRVGDALEANVGWIVAGWAAGVLLLSVRLLVSLAKAQRMRRSGSGDGCACWQEMVERIAARLPVGRPVRVLRSCLARAPVAIGWLRPAILLPASALTGLTPEQLETILAHELAHIRRHDYIVNLFQAAAETLLFYHPAVHWVSHRMRVEREHCCDDVAVSVCGDSSTYARALAKMAELEQAPSAVVAATGGALLGRISRLLGMRAPRERAASLWLVGLAGLGVLLAVTIAIVAGSAAATASPEQSATSPDALQIQVEDILAKVDQLEAEHKQHYQGYIASLSDEELARQAMSLVAAQAVNVTFESNLEWVKKERAKIVEALQHAPGNMSEAEEAPFTQRRSELVNRLAALGPGALPVLLREERQWLLIQDGVHAMGPDAVPPLLNSANDLEDRVRFKAVRALVQFRDPRAKETFVRALRDPQVRGDALDGLADLGPDAVGKDALVEAFIYDLQYGGREYRSIQGLEQYGDERAIAPLKVVEQFWPNRDKADMRYHARLAINAIEKRAGKEVKEASREDYPQTPPSREQLLKAAECPNADIRRSAAMALERSWPDETTALFLIDRLAKEDDAAVIEEIARSLWGIMQPREGAQAPGSPPGPAVVQKAFDAFLSIAEHGASADLREEGKSGAMSMVRVARQRKQRLDGLSKLKPLVREGLSSDDPDVRRGSFSAVTAIALLGDETGDGWDAAEKKALQAQLTPLLRVPKPEIRLIECLGYIGDRELTPRMIELLKHCDSTIRRFAASALGRIGDPAALPELRRLAETDAVQWADGTYGVREAAKRAIEQIENPKPQPSPKPQADASSASPQPQAETSQEGPQSESVEIQVEEILAKVDQLEREHERLQREKWERLDEKERESYALRNAYMASGLEKQLEELVKETRDQIVAMGEPAIPALIELLADTRTRTYYRNCVIGSLAKIGAASVPALIEALREGPPMQRCEAAFVLGGIRDRRAVAPLVVALKDDDANVRADAVDALGHFRDPDTVNPLTMALQDKDIGVLREAAEALGEIGDASAVPALIDAIRAHSAERDKSSGIFRSLAYTALGRIGDTRAVPILVEGLSDEGISPHKAHEVAAVDAAEALGNVGGPEATRALENAADEHRREDVRKAARQALEKIRKEELQAAGESFHVIAKWIHIGPPSERYLLEGSRFGSSFRPLDWSAVQLDADDRTVADEIKSLLAELSSETPPSVDIFHTLEGTARIGEKIVSHAPGKEAEVTLELPPAKAGFLGLRYELRVPTGDAAPPPFNVRDMRAIVPLGRNFLLTFSGGYLAKSAPPGERDIMLCLIRIDPAEPAEVEKEENEARKAAGAVAGGWSEEVNGLRGRLVIEKAKIKPSESFEVYLELKNVGSSPLSVQSGNQMWDGFQGEVFGHHDSRVPPNWVYADGNIVANGLTVEPGETTRFRLSHDLAKEAQLDVGPEAWKLEPGSYRFRGIYSSKGFWWEPGGQRPQNV